MSLTVRYAPIYKTRWRGVDYGPKLSADRVYLPVDVSPREMDPLIRAGQVERIYTDEEGTRTGPAPAPAPPGPPALRGTTVHRPLGEPVKPTPPRPRPRAATTTGGTNGRRKQRQGSRNQPGAKRQAAAPATGEREA